MSTAAVGRRRWNPSLLVGGFIVVVIVLLALVSFVWTPYDATLVDPAGRLASPSWEHWLGTDKFGRDIFSQLMVGSRTTLFVGLVAVGVAAVIGVPLGILAAMTRRWSSELIMRANDLLLAFPALLLAIMFGAVFGASTLTAMVAIGIATIPSFARVIRSGGLQVMRTEYVLAARAAGRRPLPIAVRHVLPNVVSLITVQASVSFAIAVLAEAALSFLGYGTPPPTPSWGRMLQESQEFLFSAPRLAVFPGLAIAIAVLGFNLLGDGLRDHFDPKLEDRR
ncbi:ABC transporter permease [Kribbella italica]|uniref:Peptide/nickel transport system permease protein n=1 Tax=Kribbella italica TaxID=1540520 RepID=A0A7W9MUM4_9ACTN|nr:ABC transporter permease [Kribbella italica]MBB5836340.1 peptide/nickel transport system permease protein [Kribbella italica]